MKKLPLIIIILIHMLSFSQSTKELDLKNGFKDFKFGQPYVIYSHSLKYDKEYDSPLLKDGSSWYLYINSEPSELFYVPWSKLHLVFTNNILDKIKVVFNTKDINKAKKIFNGLKQEFGEPSKTSETLFDNSYYWYGEKVTLHFSYEDTEDKFINIIIYNHSLNHINLQKSKNKF